MFDTLSNQEKRVLELICLGFDDNEIAKKLNIAWCTVRTHLTSICEKYNVFGNVRRTKLVLARIKEMGTLK